MPFPWRPGMRLTAARQNAGRLMVVEQSVDQTVTNSTTYVDSEISFTPEAPAVYAYWCYIGYSTTGDPPGSASDFRWRWDAPGADFASFTQAVHVDATGSFNAAQEVIFRRPGNLTDRIAGGAEGTDTFWSAYDAGTILVTSDDPITMQFSQNTATAEDTILRGGNTNTRLLYQRIA